MATSGGGTGTPITYTTPAGDVFDSYEETAAYPNTAVTLARYTHLIAYDECAFWGVYYTGQAQLGCGEIWTEPERMAVAQALAEAQAEMEDEIGYLLAPKWVVGQVSDEPDNDVRYVDNQVYYPRLLTRYGHVIEAGVKATTTISSGESVSHSDDPATVGPVATAATDTDEIKVYYPGSDREITPSSVSISGGNVTIRIPRCRLVKADLLHNDDTGLAYDNTNNFLATVDVKRIYNDPSTAAVLVRPHRSTTGEACDETTQTACMYIRDNALGIVDLRAGTYSAGAWNTNISSCGAYNLARLNYRCGLQTLPTRLEIALLRLAHTKMPEAVCGCDVWRNLWRKDRNVPDVITRERINCPYGLSDGAWSAWVTTRRAKLLRLGTI